jgi:hypothetical protein
LYKTKPRRPIRPERCERCRRRPATEQIRILWQDADTAGANESRDWWLCSDCASELRRDAQ